jgi:hypothetical protein
LKFGTESWVLKKTWTKTVGSANEIFRTFIRNY